MHSQVSQISLLDNNQSGFKSYHSTEIIFQNVTEEQQIVRGASKIISSNSAGSIVNPPIKQHRLIGGKKNTPLQKLTYAYNSLQFSAKINTSSGSKIATTFIPFSHK